jgi:hypothetical protein
MILYHTSSDNYLFLVNISAIGALAHGDVGGWKQNSSWDRRRKAKTESE